jgi:hypothetical protein
MSKRAASELQTNAAAASAVASPDKRAKAADGRAAASSAAASGAADASPAEHTGERTHKHHGPLPTVTSHTLKYLAGFASEHQSEALPHALPVGQNSPQQSDHSAAHTEQPT